ncbi:MAG: hypothetical protein AAF629_25665 [Chloroflexota bacterium]
MKGARQNYLLGCGVALLFILVGTVISASLLIRQIWDETQYPGAQPIVGHTGYTVKPSYIRLEQAFLSKADFTDLHAWYEDSFHLNESESTEDCIVMGNTVERLIVSRMTFVSICRTTRGQEIYVTRLLSWP